MRLPMLKSVQRYIEKEAYKAARIVPPPTFAEVDDDWKDEILWQSINSNIELLRNIWKTDQEIWPNNLTLGFGFMDLLVDDLPNTIDPLMGILSANAKDLRWTKISINSFLQDIWGEPVPLEVSAVFNLPMVPGDIMGGNEVESTIHYGPRKMEVILRDTGNIGNLLKMLNIQKIAPDSPRITR